MHNTFNKCSTGHFLLGRAWVSPTLTSTTWAVSIYIYIHVYICCHCCSVRLTINHLWLLFWAFLRHSLIQKLFTKYSEKTQAVVPRWQQQGRRPLVDLPIQCLEWYGLGHGKKVSSVDAIVCVATIAHSQWKSLVTWTDLSNNGHIDELVSESATSVHTHPAKHMVC